MTKRPSGIEDQVAQPQVAIYNYRADRFAWDAADRAMQTCGVSATPHAVLVDDGWKLAVLSDEE